MRKNRFHRHARFGLSASAVAVTAALTLSGCANPLQGVVDQVQSLGAEKLMDQMTDGKLEGIGSTQIPDDFPSVVPLPKGDPTNAVRYKEDGVVTWLLQYQNLDGPAEVAAIGTELMARGFNEDSNMSLGDGLTMALYTNDEFTVSVGLMGEADDGILQIIVMPASGR